MSARGNSKVRNASHTHGTCSSPWVVIAELVLAPFVKHLQVVQRHPLVVVKLGLVREHIRADKPGIAKRIGNILVLNHANGVVWVEDVRHELCALAICSQSGDVSTCVLSLLCFYSPGTLTAGAERRWHQARRGEGKVAGVGDAGREGVEYKLLEVWVRAQAVRQHQRDIACA
jgi:hypothetical protein